MANLIQAKSLLCLLGVVGLLGTWGRTAADGSSELLTQALDSATPQMLPGTEAPLLRTYTGVQPIDYILTMLVLFWWEVADGSHPATSAISLYYLGQLVPAAIITYTNALRGPNPSLMRYASLLEVTPYSDAF